MNNTETILLNALEDLENNRKATELEILSVLEHLKDSLMKLAERLETLEQENLEYREQIAELSTIQNETLTNLNAQIGNYQNFQSKQETILTELTKLSGK